jgi:hypothetical protein
MKILRGTIFGGITFFLLGFLVWGILLNDFSNTNYNQSIYLPANEMIWWALIASNFFLALLLTVVLHWAGAKSIFDGLKIGAIVGALYALSADFGMYSMTNVILNLSAIVVETLVNIMVMAVCGVVIVFFGEFKNLKDLSY